MSLGEAVRRGWITAVLVASSCGSPPGSTGVVAWRKACMRAPPGSQVPCLEKLVTLAERDRSAADDMARCIVELTEGGGVPDDIESLLACLFPDARTAVEALIAEDEAAAEPSSSLADAYRNLAMSTATDGEPADPSGDDEIEAR